MFLDFLSGEKERCGADATLVPHKMRASTAAKKDCIYLEFQEWRCSARARHEKAYKQMLEDGPLKVEIKKDEQKA